MNHTNELPAKGLPRDEVLARMRALREHDVRWQEGRVWSLVFPAGDEVLDISHEAYRLFFSENGLNPTAFPSLRTFEHDVVAMTARLLGGDQGTAGNMTSGGTESILLAVKTARDWARAHRPQITRPEVVLPVSAHPAFDKAAHYFGLSIRHTPLAPSYRADVRALEAALSPDTILIVGSAPAYPHGVVDPITDLAALAQARGLLCHVDACVGGMLLPFARRLGYPVPDFDFSVPGVTSLSVDLHKYGYAAKGASVILYRDPGLRRYQFFVETEWPGGIYPSPTLTGTRPGGAIAAAWAVMNYLGEAGYLALAETVMQTASRLKEGIRAIDGLTLLGEPDMSVLAIAAPQLDIYAIGDELTAAGWHLDRQHKPPSLHMTVAPGHAATAGAFLTDLRAAVDTVRRQRVQHAVSGALLGAGTFLARALPERFVSRLTAAMAGRAMQPGGLPARMAPMYGLLGTLPNRGDVRDLVLDLLDGLTRDRPA